MPIDPIVADFWASDPESLWKRPDIARVLDCSEATLERDTWKQQGIPVVRLGRRIRYRKSDVEDYLRERTVKMAGRR
jgi:phage terminase Nu1 subunit (DNA packaging protein)